MSVSVAAAAEVFRQALRDSIRRHALWYLVQGVILVLAGVFAMLYPVISSVAVVTLLGWLLIISGLAQAISLLGTRQAPHFWLQVISVALAVLIGLLFVTDTGQSLLALTLLLIVFFMIEGISKIVMALTIRPLPQWGWLFLSGLVGIVLSAALWVSMPVTALWLIGLMLGVQLLSVGGALAWLALQLRKAA